MKPVNEVRPEFEQSVAMKVTRQQFERDLKEPLEKLGYEDRKQWNEAFNPESGDMFLHTTEEGLYAWYNHTSVAYHIEDYNPELFLAIAAMTEGEIPIVGEWVKSEDFNIGIYSISKVIENGIVSALLEDSGGGVRVRYVREYDEIKKATLEELVEHLGEKEQRAQDEFALPEKWIVKTDNAEDERIVREYLNRKYGADLNNFDAEDTWYFTSKPFSWYWVSGDKNDFKDYTEITTEQFKKHVLKQDNMKSLYETYKEYIDAIEEANKKAKTTQFTKDDLKTGMIVKDEDGNFGIVLKGTSRGDIIAGGNFRRDFYCFFDQLRDNLTSPSGRKIVEVYDIPLTNDISGSTNIPHMGELLWKRKEEPKEYTITPEQAKSIIDIACFDWKDKLFDLWGKQIIFKRDITVSYPFYKQMRRDFSHKQHELFDSIFKK